jgi:peptidoglycan/xylan/chitin deacetylase (PgdA/CDA1 family)
MRHLIRKLIKELVLRAMGNPAILVRKIERITKTKALTILNLHRVSNDDGSTYPPLEPALFDYLLTFLKKHFIITTFDEACRGVEERRPKLILSFDDGYKDFIDVAVPILSKHGVRANQNIIPLCVETGLPPLNVIMQDFVGRAPLAALNKLQVPGFAITRPVRSRYDLGNQLSLFLKSKRMVEQDRMRGVLLSQISQVTEFRPTCMMTLEDVRKISRNHDIGAHSFAHASLGYESNCYVRNDFEQCRRYFDEKLGLPMTIYALPNGSYREDQLTIFRSAGVKHILLVNEDFSRSSNTLHPRFTFYARSKYEARFRATGTLRWSAFSSTNK